MKLEEALPILREGRRIRRSLWNGNPKFIRLVDPRMERELDGPETTYRIRIGDTVTEDVYVDEKDAKADLAKFKRDLAKAWKLHDEFVKKFEALEDMERGSAERIPAPASPRNTYEDSEVVRQAANRAGRINTKILLAHDRDSSVLPYVPTLQDILADDWSEA